MKKFALKRRIIETLVAWVAPAFLASAAALDPKEVEFFEKNVRPVLVESCYKCHSKEAGDKVKGGLYLDTREGLLKGGETGPSLVPGDPDKSLLIKAVRYADEGLQMPPKNKKLTAQQIADLEAWVKMGAPDPREGKTVTGPPLSDPEKVRTHWAFQPVKDPKIPAVKNARWVQTPVDAFILSKLEANKMTPSKVADKRTLLRRAAYDLTGLPPAEGDVEKFLADKSSDAFAKVVDRLLASPQYGERWARHWLDVARYADTKGYLAGDEQRRYPYSYTYRDYVIRAFNEDLPYDRFIVEQLAADLLPLGEDKRPLAALGFLTLGRRFLNNQQDIIDDRIDVVARGTMALTVTCARCHDHKFDPIPTKDYYSLYGVFSNTMEPAEKPLLGTKPPEKLYQEYLAERQKREQEMEDFKQGELAKAMAEQRKRSGDYLLATTEFKADAGRRDADKFARERKLEAAVLRRWADSVEAWKKETSPIFAPWFAFIEMPEKDYATKGKELAATFAGNGDSSKPVNPVVAKAFANATPTNLKQVSELYGKVFVEVEKQWQETTKAAEKAKEAAPKALSDANEEALRQVLYGPKAPAELPAADQDSLLGAAKPRLRQLRAKIEEVDAIHPGAPPRAMAVQDLASLHGQVVFVRGNAGNRGPEVPRQFLQVVSGDKRQPFQKGSGRLEMAEAIVSKDNPLTPRVIVNRVWLQHFGSGLVRTPSDFGVRADPPSHPELLDYLASRLMESGWSLKKLHRLIMLSSVYQQTSDDRADYVKQDSSNQLLWKMNRQRLTFEAMRDTLLTVSGQLDLTPGGLPADITTQPFNTRRTVYGLIDRQNLPSLFRAFDFANPDTTSPQRFNTTVPQQTLYMMNSPFVIEMVRDLVNRPDFKALTKDDERVRFLFKMLYQRTPDPDEIKMGQTYLNSIAGEPAKGPESIGWQYGYGEYDETTKHVKQFTPLPHFTGSAWQGGGKLPDDKLGWLLLTAEGGHAGNDLKHATIRRWIAPRDGTVSITGALQHSADQGDGVRGRVISSRSGIQGEWQARNSKADIMLERMEVKEGDAIDFMVDLNKSIEHDSFTWSPHIKFSTADRRTKSRAMSDKELEWDAATDFGKAGREQAKPLTAWERYAQVLMLANELVFVD